MLVGWLVTVCLVQTNQILNKEKRPIPTHLFMLPGEKDSEMLYFNIIKVLNNIQ